MPLSAPNRRPAEFKQLIHLRFLIGIGIRVVIILVEALS